MFIAITIITIISIIIITTIFIIIITIIIITSSITITIIITILLLLLLLLLLKYNIRMAGSPTPRQLRNNNTNILKQINTYLNNNIRQTTAWHSRESKALDGQPPGVSKHMLNCLQRNTEN